uniref:Titin n=1 Tax=Eptatretus burgeri TaxID=7764 RepID=A0A8C4QLJ7_EPTBU
MEPAYPWKFLLWLLQRVLTENQELQASQPSSAITKESVVVAWKPPISDGGAKIRNYYLEKREKKQTRWIAVTTEDIRETVYSVTGLIEGLEYEFHVKCENLGGESDWSEPSDPVIPKSDVPIQPPCFKEELRNLNVKHTSNATFVCKVTGHPKPVVKWYRQGKELDPDGEKIIFQEFKGGYHQLVISNVKEEDSAVYQVRATNQGGSISASASLDVEIPAKIHLPKHLEGMGAVHALRGEIVSIKIPFSGRPDPVITWQKGQDLIDNNGHYQVIVTRSFTSLVFMNGVQISDAGFYVVCAKNRFGIDQKTVELDVADVPDSPRGLKVVDVTRDSVALEWAPPASDGGSRVLSYTVEKCATTALQWIRVASTRDPHYTVIDLFGKTSYQFRVIAENKFGQSQPSEPTQPVTTKENKLQSHDYDLEVDDSDTFQTSVAHTSSTKVLHERYNIAEQLGRGEFGIVHRCVETRTKKTYLAKFSKVKGVDQVQITKEISILNKARHQNILNLHEAFESLEEIVMIFEFISGQDIFERMLTVDLTEREIIMYIHQVCSALAFLHHQNIGHFDIRPENIIYMSRVSSRIKIVEFGHARALTPGETFRIGFTAAEYFAPEVHMHDLVHTQTDMWSVGTLTYVLLSGLNPFAAETNQQMVENIERTQYTFDEEAFKDVTIEALDFVDRLLVKERRHRMTAEEALKHVWLKQKVEKTSTKVIRTMRHRRYYQVLVKKDWNVSISAARIAMGGPIRTQRGVTVAKVKVAPSCIGPVAGSIWHSAVEEGQHAYFICHIENYDQATQVTWYSGVRQLENCEHHEISYEEGVAKLTIDNLNKSDDGTYRCKVVNEYGEDSSYCDLFIKGVREYRDHYMQRTKKVKRPRDTMRLLERPPEFTLPLYNRTDYVGDTIRFGVTITVHPEPRVTWYKSGQKIKPEEDEKKYKFEYDKGLYQLVIHNLTDDDSAEYSVVARNRYGEDFCKANLSVVPRPKAKEDTLRPMFKRLLANVECQEGETVRFECRIGGVPLPKLVWEKDGELISLGQHVEILHEGLDYFTLIIHHTFIEDSGMYRVTATNSAGSASCQAYLKVARITYVRRRYRSDTEREVQVKKHVDKTVKIAEIMSGAESTSLTPVAKEALRQASIMYKPAVSTRTVKGEYTIEKKVLEEKKEIRMPYTIPAPRKALTLEESHAVTVSQMAVTESHEGKLVSESHSDFERSFKESMATEETSTFKTVKTSHPARITTRPQSVTVTQGERVQFDCVTDGEPVPSVMWSHEGKPVTSSARHTMTTSEYHSVLKIKDVEPSDEGTYTVIAENSEGKDEAKFTLTIRKSVAKEPSKVTIPRVKSPERKTVDPKVSSSEGEVKSPDLQTSSSKQVQRPPAETSQSKKSTEDIITAALEGNRADEVNKMPTSQGEEPFFSARLQDMEAQGDSIAKLSVRISTTPTAVVQWSKDGKVLSQGGKYEIFEEAGGFHLEIYDTESSDSGCYMCTATNSAGTSTTCCILTIKSTKESLNILQLSSQKSTNISDCTGIVHEEVVKQEFPSRHVKASDIETMASKTKMSISEGQNVTLKATIPEASDVKWLINGMEVRNSSNHQYGRSGADQTLTISKATHYDSGIITCEGKTQQGIVKCQFDVMLEDLVKNVPVFITQPRSQNVNEGQNVIFTCEVSGDPHPVVEWMKDKELVSITKHMKLSQSKNIHTLEILKVNERNSGKYTVIAKNINGQCAATVSLSVFPLVEEPAKQMVLANVATTGGIKNLEMVQKTSDTTEELLSSSTSQKSMFTMASSTMSSKSETSSLSHCEIQQSGQVHVEYGSAHRPFAEGEHTPPVIEALPTEVSISRGKVLTVTCTFTASPSPEDAGLYTLQISNALGMSSSDVLVHIL